MSRIKTQKEQPRPGKSIKLKVGEWYVVDLEKAMGNTCWEGKRENAIMRVIDGNLLGSGMNFLGEWYDGFALHNFVHAIERVATFTEIVHALSKRPRRTKTKFSSSRKEKKAEIKEEIENVIFALNMLKSRI